MSVICLKFRLYPSKSQETKLRQTFETCQDVYNSLLNWRKYAYEIEGKTIGRYEQQAALPVWKDKTDAQGNLLHPELKEVHSQVLQDIVHRVDLAYKAFFRRVQNGEKPGFPRAKGRGQYDSISYTQTGFSIHEQVIKFSKIGMVKAILHREILGKVKQCILRQQGGDYYACLITELPDQPLPPCSDAVGMDMGLEKFAVLSTGERIENPRFFRKQEKRLAKAQRKLECDKKDRKKSAAHRKTISRIHKKTSNQRHDFLHQTTHKLVNRFGIFFLEDLNVKNMSKRPAPKRDENTGEYLPNGASAKSGLNKSILDASWSRFRILLTEKAERAGRQVIEVNPAYTSQDCYVCGYRAKKKLSDRWHFCPICGASLDRDFNSAMNIFALGMQRIGVNP